MNDLPRPTLDALIAHQALSHDLMQWSATAHKLVKERITALLAAYGKPATISEDHDEWAGRVLADGQNPFPPGTSIYDDLNNNTAYSNVEIGYGRGPDDGPVLITFTGNYAQWAPGGDNYRRLPASIHIPAWVVCDPAGIDRYKAQTQLLAAKIREQRTGELAMISDLVDEVLGGRGQA